ncbi:hypothetical protein [Streptomyces sp. NPDC050485]|uniref:hypothetical protein n=1 Tax=Streptomyces sp. NPDC050485 TaxID=3365617 RepID=UPI00379A99E6
MPVSRHQPGGIHTALIAVGAAVLAIACCAGPALIAAGALGVLGAVLANPFAIAAAVLLATTATAWALHRRQRARQD